MAEYATITSDKSKKTALILCACLGWFGVHDFYLGNIGKGILKACTVNFIAIGWFIDLAKIAAGTYKDGAGAPVRK